MIQVNSSVKLSSYETTDLNEANQAIVRLASFPHSINIRVLALTLRHNFAALQRLIAGGPRYRYEKSLNIICRQVEGALDRLLAIIDLRFVDDPIATIIQRDAQQVFNHYQVMYCHEFH